VYEQNPEIVAKLERLLEKCRYEIGDEVEGVQGTEVRPVGRVENPKPLTEYDENHPYIIALYDRTDSG